MSCPKKRSLGTWVSAKRPSKLICGGPCRQWPIRFIRGLPGRLSLLPKSHARATTVESVNEVEEQAAEWLIKRDSGRWTEADQQALDQWLEASTAHMVAFIRLESAWQRADQLKALGAGSPRGVVPSPDDWQLSAVFR